MYSAGLDWPVMSVFRLAILGGDFVVNENSAWDTTLGFGFFTFIFNVVMCVDVPVTLTLHYQSARCCSLKRCYSCTEVTMYNIQ